MTKRSKTVNSIIAKTIMYAILILFTLWLIVPFSIILSVSVKTWEEAGAFGFSWLPKAGFTWEGYKTALDYKYFGDETSAMIRGAMNTVMYVIPPTVLGLFSSAVAAYAFAKLRFKAKNAMFSVLIFTMLIPGVITIAPTYLLFNTIYWIDTPLPLMIPGMFGAAACVFFMRQFYAGIPDALIEAAKLDGMGYWAIFFKIIVPLSVPALLAQGILGFVGGYNDYFGPLIYLQSPHLYTLQLALNNFAGTFVKYVNVVMAGAVLALIPTLIIYAVAQKYFIEGIATSGMKL